MSTRPRGSRFVEASGWQFSAAVPQDRQDRLRGWKSFEVIVDHLAREIEQRKDVKFQASSPVDPALHAQGCHRAEFHFAVDPETADAFFNSAVGLRAQFLEDPNLGQFANGWALAMLDDALRAHVADVPALTPLHRTASLRAGSAMLWAHEPQTSAAEEIAVDRWLRAARAGAAKAKLGVSAPAITRLEVKGAWIDRAGNEVVPAGRIERRFEIARFGFA